MLSLAAVAKLPNILENTTLEKVSRILFETQVFEGVKVLLSPEPGVIELEI